MSRQYQNQGYVFCWQDETWANAHHTHGRVWQIRDNPESKLPSERGHGGLRVPSGAGRRVIINHAGCENTGFLPVGDIFIGKTGSGDYHTEMNTEHWMDWFVNKVLPSLPPKSVFIVDNAK